MTYKVTKVGNQGSVKIDMTGLNLLLAAVQEKYAVRVGILGSKATQTHQRKLAGGLAKGGGHTVSKIKSPKTNAEIGLDHEKGVKSRNLPRRSWLEIPLLNNLPIYFQKLGSIAIRDILINQKQQSYNNLGAICVQIITKGFESDGYGKWAPLKAETIANKGSDRVLVDTAQLENSIDFEVINK